MGFSYLLMAFRRSMMRFLACSAAFFSPWVEPPEKRASILRNFCLSASSVFMVRDLMIVRFC